MKTECYDIFFRPKIHTQLVKYKTILSNDLSFTIEKGHTLGNIFMERHYGKYGMGRRGRLRKSNWRCYFAYLTSVLLK